MTKSWEEQWTFNPFTRLLADAIEHDIEASISLLSKGKDISATNRFSRASITSATLAIEAAANSCIHRMQYPKLVIEQLDKLNVVDKFAVLYSARFGREIDKGAKYFQTVKELIQLRNRYVHPKLNKTSVSIELGDDGIKKYKILDGEVSPILNLPIDFDLWTSEHSHNVIKETIRFCNYFFNELCNLTQQQSNELLTLHVKGPSNSANLLREDEVNSFLRVKDLYGVEIRFLVVNE